MSFVIMKKIVRNNLYNWLTTFGLKKREIHSHITISWLIWFFANNFFKTNSKIVNPLWTCRLKEKKFLGPLKDRGQKTFTLLPRSDFILKILHYYCSLVYTHLNFLVFLYTVFTAFILSALDTTTQNFWKTLR